MPFLEDNAPQRPSVFVSAPDLAVGQKNPSQLINLKDSVGSRAGRLLVFDCHEAWVYQLRFVEMPMDIVVGLSGRHRTGWDEAMRPLPPNSRLLKPTEIIPSEEAYRCIIAHNLSDLLDAKLLPGPRILVLHETLDGALREQRSTVSASELKRAVERYTELTSTHVVAVSHLKGKSWGFSSDIVCSCAAPEDYAVWKGDLARGLRIANHILRRPHTLLWDYHQKAFGDLPVTLVGHNPEMNGVQPAQSWNDLKSALSRHRFYIHTADPKLEDGFNMATLEAMAAGLPVLGNRHPTSPVEHGVSGFLSNDAAELRDYALRLLTDRELARRMGAAAQRAVAGRFSPARFSESLKRSLAFARRKWAHGLERQLNRT